MNRKYIAIGCFGATIFLLVLFVMTKTYPVPSFNSDPVVKSDVVTPQILPDIEDSITLSLSDDGTVSLKTGDLKISTLQVFVKLPKGRESAKITSLNKDINVSLSKTETSKTGEKYAEALVYIVNGYQVRFETPILKIASQVPDLRLDPLLTKATLLSSGNPVKIKFNSL